ncbi:hypothetical protein [Candidatus Palauibacter sp.]|uniref:hypothetical protein n=1 Tax=Candidatus Palauibacter sp. TaxID=3101350 RepID=UPI003B52241C
MRSSTLVLGGSLEAAFETRGMKIDADLQRPPGIVVEIEEELKGHGKAGAYRFGDESIAIATELEDDAPEPEQPIALAGEDAGLACGSWLIRNATKKVRRVVIWEDAFLWGLSEALRLAGVTVIDPPPPPGPMLDPLTRQTPRGA